MIPYSIVTAGTWKQTLGLSYTWQSSAYDLPNPVGATTSTSHPLSAWRQISSCGPRKSAWPQNFWSVRRRAAWLSVAEGMRLN